MACEWQIMLQDLNIVKSKRELVDISHATFWTHATCNTISSARCKIVGCVLTGPGHCDGSRYSHCWQHWWRVPSRLDSAGKAALPTTQSCSTDV